MTTSDSRRSPDSKDELHIRGQKTDRCYKFNGVIETPGFVEVRAK